MSRLLFLITLLLLPSQLLAAEATNSLYYILDGSGSMWGRVDGKPKITVAKNVMSTLITEMPENVHAGLTVYGHRKKGDCSDIEEVLPLGEIERAAAIRKVKNISPKGKTPITDSIQLAVGKLKANEQASTVVLVSDGIETCGKDPCALTKSLRESGVNFVMHVVGFGVKDNDVKQLSCIAKAGGGKFYQSKSAKQLLAALNEVKKSVVEKKPIVIKAEPVPVIEEKPEPEPEPTRVSQKLAKKSKSIRIKAKGPGRIKFKHHGWQKAPYFWRLIDPESGEDKGSFNDLTTATVAPGDYQLVWRHNQHRSRNVILGEVFSVESGKTTEVPLLTAVSLVLPDWIKNPYRWQLIDPATGDRVAEYRFIDEPVLVPSGTYELHWQQNQHTSQMANLGRFTIEPDKENRIELSTGINLLKADWVPEKLYFWGLRGLEQRPGKYVAWYKNTDPQLVPAGKYYLIYHKNQHLSTNSNLGIVEIKDGQINEVELNTGVQLIQTDSSIEAPYKIEFIKLNAQGKKEAMVHSKKSLDPMLLQPGKYKITYQQKQHGSSKVTIVEEFELPAGNLVEIEL